MMIALLWVAFLLALLLGPAYVAAQSPSVSNEAIESETNTSENISESALTGFNEGYFWVQGDFGERPGISGNYASFGGFAPIDFLGPNQQFFLDGQMTVDDDTRVGANIGLGYRRLVEDWGSIFGANAFYAYDQSVNSYSYNQASVGGEWLTEYFQLTGNIYIPFDMQENNVGPPSYSRMVFIGNQLVSIRQQPVESQARGVDINLAVPIPGVEWLTAAGGAYRYDSKYIDAYSGWRAQLQGNFRNVTTSLTFAKDDVYGSQINVAATYFFGGSHGNDSRSHMSLYERMNSRVRRQARIPAESTIVDELASVNDPRNGTISISFIDPSAISENHSPFENGFNSLGRMRSRGH